MNVTLIKKIINIDCWIIIFLIIVDGLMSHFNYCISITYWIETLVNMIGISLITLLLLLIFIEE
jgi:hypothetical protein